MRLVNEVKAPAAVQDRRTGSYSKNVSSCVTPYGGFRSVSVARDHILANVPMFYWDIRALDEKELSKRVYSRIYQRCRKNTAGWSSTPAVV